MRVLDNTCCGLPAWSYGDLPAARNLAGKNLPMLAADGFDTLVTDCSSCTGFIKKYPRLFAEDDPQRKAAESAAGRTRDVSEWLAAEVVPRSRALEGRRATFHDPCHAARGQGLVKPPRDLLRRMPGAEFVELPEADWCCGGAGS